MFGISACGKQKAGDIPRLPRLYADPTLSTLIGQRLHQLEYNLPLVRRNVRKQFQQSRLLRIQFALVHPTVKLRLRNAQRQTNAFDRIAIGRKMLFVEPILYGRRIEAGFFCKFVFRPVALLQQFCDSILYRHSSSLCKQLYFITVDIKFT